MQACSTADFAFEDRGKLYSEVRVKMEVTQNSLEMVVIRLGVSL
jgi:hypothetical protein